MVHISYIIRIRMSHELQELIKVRISPLHPFLKQEVVILQLLKSTINRIRSFYIFRCSTVIRYYHGFISNSCLNRTHSNTLRTRKSYVTICSMMKFVHIVITYETVNNFNPRKLYIDILSTCSLHE